MGKRSRVYLDTSVPNAYLEERDLSRMEKTRSFWGRIGQYQIFISDLVIQEIEDIGDPVKRRRLLALVSGFQTMRSKNGEIASLAVEYVGRGIIPMKHVEDAVHIAVATFYEIDVLTSWNFEHIVKLKAKREINVINVLLGYNQLEIVEPSML